jgi:hypothetical protein
MRLPRADLEIEIMLPIVHRFHLGFSTVRRLRGDVRDRQAKHSHDRNPWHEHAAMARHGILQHYRLTER